MLRSALILQLLILLSPGPVDAAALRPLRLRCDYAENPLGVDVRPPQLSWTLASRERGVKQSAYRILVASTAARLREGQADLWDSGVVRSSQSAHLVYGGVPLTSRQRAHWRVRVWDVAGKASAWSAPAWWEMGLLEPHDWQARWIGAGPAHEPRLPAGFIKDPAETNALTPPIFMDGRSLLLRKAFLVGKPIRAARVYVSGLGYYELRCNGQRVGDQVLAPAKSTYRKWVLYDSYDLTPLLRQGTNALGLMLGNGWYNPYPKWWQPYRMPWFGAKRAILQLHLQYRDGASEVVISDDSWKRTPGPILAACVYDGEVYDATQEKAGWDGAAYDDADWSAALVMEPPGGALVSQVMPPIRVTEHLRPASLHSPKPGVYVFDLGQNMAGWARLTAAGRRGTRISLRYAEDAQPDGSIDVTSNEHAAATDVYVMKGEGQEIYEPRFTFHGFRYVEVTGLTRPPRRDDLVGCVVHSDCEATGTFVCDHDLVNRIHRATRWSQRSNLMGYPMDCPQRDERLGWLGDAMVTAEEALLNFDTALFFRHWLAGIRHNQNEVNGDISIISPRPYLPDEPDPTWSSAYLLTVWQFYLHYGDRQFLAGHFDAMRRYVEFLGTQANHHLLPRYWIGDWGTIIEGWQEGDPVSVATAFYYCDVRILAKAARVLGRAAEAERYAALAAQIREAYQRAFYDAKQRQFDQGSQCSNALPLVLGLVEATERPAVLQAILDDLQRHNGHFTVGVLGAKYLLEALTLEGRPDIAYALVTARGYPSWAHLLVNRTTLSEFWDLRGSHNHVMLGSVDAWFYRVLAGIQPDEQRPGFEHVIVQPFIPESLSYVNASIQTIRGRVAVEWQKLQDSLRLRVTIPPNTDATIHVPAGSLDQVRATRGLGHGRRENQTVVFATGSGIHEFRVTTRDHDPPR